MLGAIPKGRIFPLTRDELAEAIALVTAVGERQLDRIPQPGISLDVLAQQIVAMVGMDEWEVEDAYELVRGAAPGHQPGGSRH